MIGHRGRFRDNDELPLWRGPESKKKPPFSNAGALITCKIMRSRVAQCNNHNPVLFGGLFIRVELLEALGLTPLFLPRAICFGLISSARYVLRYLNISSGWTKFEIFREQVGYLYILYYYARPECMINCCKLCCSLSRVSYLSFIGFARDSCRFPFRKL